MAVLRGEAVDGRGNAKPLIEEHAGELVALTGVDLFPGSLNVVLRRPARFDTSAALRFDAGRRMVWPATVDGLDVWAYRWKGTRLHVVEVLAGERLRDLIDPGDVRVEVSDDMLAPVRAVPGLAWALFWWGRRDWYYRGDRYQSRLRKWEWRARTLQE